MHHAGASYKCMVSLLLASASYKGIMQARHPGAVTCSAMLLLRDVTATRRCSGWVCKEAAAEPWWCIAWSSTEGRPKAGDDGAWNHRVVKSLRLEMATRITKPNCQPTTTVCFGGRWVCIASHVDTHAIPKGRGRSSAGCDGFLSLHVLLREGELHQPEQPGQVSTVLHSPIHFDIS